MNSKILFQGNFSEKNVECKFKNVTSRKIDPQIEIKAKNIWNKKVTEAEKIGKKIWDQPVYRLEKYKVDEDKCLLEFSDIAFSIRASLKIFTQQLRVKGDKYLPMAVYSSIFVETKDARFVFREKSDKYLARSRFNYIGGVFNRDTKLNSKVDLFDSATTELKEELGISDKDINMLVLLGAFRSRSGNVAMIFYCQLKLDRKGLMKKFKNRKDPELEDLFFVKRQRIRDTVVNKIQRESEAVDIFEINVSF